MRTKGKTKKTTMVPHGFSIRPARKQKGGIKPKCYVCKSEIGHHETPLRYVYIHGNNKWPTTHFYHATKRCMMLMQKERLKVFVQCDWPEDSVIADVSECIKHAMNTE